jgi:putative membrane protein
MFACLSVAAEVAYAWSLPPLRQRHARAKMANRRHQRTVSEESSPRLPSSVPPPSSSSSSISRRSSSSGSSHHRSSPTELRAEAVLFDASDEGMTTITGTLNDADPYRRPDTDASANYLDRLTRYSDDGYTLSAPQRYSITDWYKNVLSIPKSRVLVRVRSHLIFNFVWSLGVTALFYSKFMARVARLLPNPAVFDKLNLFTPFAMSGGILGILLAFRTSQSYERFWHGREIWAKVVNTVRSFARTITYVDEPEPDFVDTMNRWLKAFPTTFMQHLRGERSVNDLKTLTASDLRLIEASDNMPICCTMVLSELINKIKSDPNQGAASLLWWQMESFCKELMDCVGEGEAIAGTPVPVSYSRHTSRLLSIWTLCCPFVFVQCLPPLAVPFVTVIVSWMLLATEEIGHVIEEPFGIHEDRPNILPLQRYCDVIEKDVEMMSRENTFMEVVVPTEEEEIETESSVWDQWTEDQEEIDWTETPPEETHEETDLDNPFLDEYTEPESVLPSG